MIYTSNFSTKRFNIEDSVSISVGTPTWYRGVIFKELQPTWEMVIWHKNGVIDDIEYTNLYYEKILNKLDPKEIYEKLDNKILLCWCSKNKFCHRHIVSKWFNENNLECKEF